MKAEALDRVRDLSGATAQLEVGVRRVKEAVVAVLKVSGVKRSDLGEPNRAFASIQTAGAQPRWIEKC